MIATFPDPYPDELLFSVCARYAERMQYPNQHAVLQDLFGNRNKLASVALPSLVVLTSIGLSGAAGERIWGGGRPEPEPQQTAGAERFSQVRRCSSPTAAEGGVRRGRARR